MDNATAMPIPKVIQMLIPTTKPVGQYSNALPPLLPPTPAPNTMYYCIAPSGTAVTAVGLTYIVYKLDNSWPKGSYIAGYYDNNAINAQSDTNYGYTLSGTAAKDSSYFQITVNPQGLVSEVTVDVVFVILTPVPGKPNVVTLCDPQDTEVPV